MKIIGLLSLTLSVIWLVACQPQAVNHVAQQQHFICKSLIEGFLKTQQLGNYQLDHLQPTLHQTASIRQYSYRAGSEQSSKINIPVQHNLTFECQQNSAQHFEVKLVNTTQNTQQTILSLNLPAQQTIKTLTAFALKNQ